MKRIITRRSFLRNAAAASTLGPLIVPRLSFADSPSSRLQHAAIGVGGQGAYDLGQINGSKKVDVVALCDIDETNLAKAHERYPKARLYRDWREMLEEEEDNLDSVNVSTPDHTHAPASMTAIRKGLHTFCEKPLTHDVYEARKLTLAARRYDVATQMGIQIHSHDAYRIAVIWLQEGAIGKVKEWHSWSDVSHTYATGRRPETSDPVPDHVDWNLWLGTAPERPFKNEIYHPFEWRGWRDFGSGAAGDFACHIFDPLFTALGVTAPTSVRSEAGSNHEEVHPAWAKTEYVFPGTDLTAGNTIRGTWMDGGKQPSTSISPHLPEGFELPSHGSMVIGEDGTMIIPHFKTPGLYPSEKFENYPMPDIETKNHYHEFVEAAMGNVVASTNFDFAGPLTETVLLSNIANRFPGETLEWNAKRMRFTNHHVANQLLRRRYRKEFKVRGL